MSALLNVTLAKGGEERSPRRLGAIDLLIVLVVVTLLVLAAARWMAKLSPVVHIQLGVGMLPVYAGYSLLRMLLAYLLSLIFTLVYGHIAAQSRLPADPGGSDRYDHRTLDAVLSTIGDRRQGDRGHPPEL